MECVCGHVTHVVVCDDDDVHVVSDDNVRGFHVVSDDYVHVFHVDFVS